MKKHKTWKILVICGTMLILSALFLCVWNLRESEQAYEISQDVLMELKQSIPEAKPAEQKQDTYVPPAVNPADDLFAPYEQQKEEDEPKGPQPICVDGAYYCGFITLPSLNLELPVMQEWSYPNLKKSPCRYDGEAVSKNLILAAHNYTRHFGKIRRLNVDDEIYFTDTEGVQYRFRVINTQEIGGYDLEKLKAGAGEDWDITLFTCTLGGQSRVVVRGVLQENGDESA